MSEIDIDQFMESYRKVEDTLSTTIKIDHRQVGEIVVKDLIKKYKFNLGRVKKDDKIIESFKNVLLYYMDEAELKEYMEKVPADDSFTREEVVEYIEKLYHELSEYPKDSINDAVIHQKWCEQWIRENVRKVESMTW